MRPIPIRPATFTALAASAVFLLFAPVVSAVPILIETTGSVEVTRLHWISSGCDTGYFCGPTGLENGPQQLAVSLLMMVEPSTGQISSGAISIVGGQSLLIGNGANYTAQEIVFDRTKMSFAGAINGALSGFFDEGRLTFILRSHALTVDIGLYRAAEGPAVIPVVGASSLNGTEYSFDLSSESFRHHNTGSSATIDLELGAFSFEIEPIPEPSTALLMGLGLFGLAARKEMRSRLQQ